MTKATVCRSASSRLSVWGRALACAVVCAACGSGGGGGASGTGGAVADAAMPDAAVVAPDGAAVAPDGTAVAPDGAAITPDATVVETPDAVVVATPDAAVVATPDAAVVAPPDAAVVAPPDAAVVAPSDAAVVAPDAAIVPPPDAALPPPVAPQPLPHAGAILDAAWADPTFPPFMGNPPPPASHYGILPDGWDAAAIQRYSAANTPKSIMEIGDSISESQAFIEQSKWIAGSGVSTAEGYTHLPKALATLAGQESVWGASIVNGALDAAHAEAASVMFGTNDARHGVDLAAYEANMTAIVDACIAHGTLPILMTLPPINGGVDVVAPYSQVIRTLAATRQVPLFDLQQLLIDRGQLATDQPDGLHPSADAYDAIDVAWIVFYKQLEFAALSAGRGEPVGGVDPHAALRAEIAQGWQRVYERNFTENADLTGFNVVSGEWTVTDGVLHGRSAANDAAIVHLPIRLNGPVKVELVAAGDNTEISLITNNGGDLDGTDGWYFGHGTNSGARTSILFQDQRVANVEGIRPVAYAWEHLQAWRTASLARLGVNGAYVLDYATQGEVDGPDHGRVGLYVWGGTMHVHQIVVWAPQ